MSKDQSQKLRPLGRGVVTRALLALLALLLFAPPAHALSVSQCLAQGGSPQPNGTCIFGNGGVFQTGPQGPQGPPGAPGAPGPAGSITSNYFLTVLATDSLSTLPQPLTAGAVLYLRINGVAYSSIDMPACFTVSGHIVTWNAAVCGFHIATTDSVTATYFIGSSTPGITYGSLPITSITGMAPNASAGLAAGFTGTKTAGSCVLTILGGVITNVTGC